MSSSSQFGVLRKGGASIFAFALASQQHVFWVYHMNSYANLPIMLRSPKPLVMRDVFLTKCTAPFANPLSTFYVPYTIDMFFNTTAAWLFGMGIGPLVGPLHLLACFFVGGFFSGMAYLFQSQLNPKARRQTEFDCNCSSNGGWSAVAALGIYLKPEQYGARLPFIFSRVPVTVLCYAYILQALAQEYVTPLRDWYPRLPVRPTSQTARDLEEEKYSDLTGQPRLSNWGSIGGIFLGLMYGTFAVRMKGNKQGLAQVLDSVKAHQKK